MDMCAGSRCGFIYSRVLVGMCAALLFFIGACTAESDASATKANAADAAPTSSTEAKKPPADGTIAHLEGRFGDPTDMWAESSYKVKRERGFVTRELKVKLEGAGADLAGPLAIKIDGIRIGTLNVSAKGKGKYSVEVDEDSDFPEGFPVPKAGSTVQIGDIVEFDLSALEKLAYLESELDGPGDLSGKITFKVERLAGDVTREFQVKVDGGEANSAHTVKLDGRVVGELMIDFEGRGRLKYSSIENLPFPEDFEEPALKSQVDIGSIYSGGFFDKLAASGT
jgi:hypothetical protein